MSPEEREQRRAANAAAKRNEWDGMSLTQRQVRSDRARAARKYLHGDRIARTKYAQAGIPDAEIAILMAMDGVARKMARLRWRDYGIKPSEVIAMRESQHGLCALCDQPLPIGFHVDHDHITGKARGLLCGRCNMSLGHLEARGEAWAKRALEWVAYHR
jgi:hypothetical protein